MTAPVSTSAVDDERDLVYTGFRLPAAEREALEEFKRQGGFETLGHAARAAIARGLGRPEPAALKSGRRRRETAQEALPL